jgi:hypothetical protein
VTNIPAFETRLVSAPQSKRWISRYLSKIDSDVAAAADLA